MFKKLIEDANKAYDEANKANAKEEKRRIREAERRRLELEEHEKNLSAEIKEIRTQYVGKNFERVQRRLNAYGRAFRNYCLLVITILPIISGLLNYINNTPFNKEQQVEYKGIELNVKMLNDDGDIKLQYEPVNLTIKIQDAQKENKQESRFIEIDQEVIKSWQSDKLLITDNNFIVNNSEYEVPDDMELVTLDCYKGMMYATYANSNSTAMREIMLGDVVPEDFDTTGLKRSGFYTLKETTDLKAKILKDSFENSIIYYTDILAGGKLGSNDLETRVKSIESKLKYSVLGENEVERVVINFDELGSIDLNKIKEFNNSAGVYWSNSDGILRLFNSRYNEAYAYVTSINNPTFLCNSSDLLMTNYDKLYVTTDFDNPEGTGYRTFALSTESNVYVFRVAKHIDESFLTDLLKQFDIDRDNIKIKVVQSVVEDNR